MPLSWVNSVLRQFLTNGPSLFSPFTFKFLSFIIFIKKLWKVMQEKYFGDVEMSMEDCWLNGRFVPWQSMVNHSRL